MCIISQYVKSMVKLKIDEDKDYVICGDCLDWLDHIPKGSVNMCYIDPPFFSNRTYEIIWKNGWESRCFEDRFKTINHYSDWMEERIKKIKKCLKPNGTIFVHCDYRANYKLRAVLNDIFGEDNFINEIIWSYKTGGTSSKYFARKHDTIFWYSKNKQYTYNLIKERSYLSHKYGFSNITTYEDDKGLYRMVYPRDIFDIDAIRGNQPGSIKYKTQKPEALLKKIIQCSTNENDTVLDCFSGGGTTASVCKQLKQKRRFITGDVSPVACRVTMDRLAKLGSKPEYPNELRTKQEWIDLDGHEFARKVCEYIGWKCNPKKSRDRGVDAWNSEGEPIQIKNRTNPVGENVIKELASTVMMKKKKRGLIVTWKLSKLAYDAIAVLKKTKGIHIDFRCAEDILESIIIVPIKR